MSQAKGGSSMGLVKPLSIALVCAFHLLAGIHIGRGTLPFCETAVERPPLSNSEEDPLSSSVMKAGAKAPEPPQNIIFSLGLPNSGASILPRYFQCAGLGAKLGRYWSRQRKTPMGRCLKDNLSKGSSLLENCGNYTIWHELQYTEPPSYLVKNSVGKCFDPVLFPEALKGLHQSAPNATVLVLKKNPQKWYQTLSYDLHKQWSEWCNPLLRNNNLKFPANNTQEEYVAFYQEYHQLIQSFVEDHPGWNLIEIDLEDPAQETAQRLEGLLHIDSHCWLESVNGSIPGSSLLPRPNDITYPLLTVSMPKSGTTTVDSYFKCNLGRWATAHQWTHRSGGPPYRHTSIGDCLKGNAKMGRPLLQNCGFARVYSDIGTIAGHHPCYYAQLQGGLENFAQAYPYATLLLTVRNASAWVSSVQRWNELDQRLASRCQDVFPATKAPAREWETFYDNHVDFVRSFARDHPTLTYLEVELDDQAGSILDDITGFPEGCWAHKNANAGIRTSIGGKKRQQTNP